MSRLPFHTHFDISWYSLQDGWQEASIEADEQGEKEMLAQGL
jgi:hypothetical protein